MNKQNKNQTDIKKLKLRKSFNKIFKISDPSKRELQKAIEAEISAQEKGITTDKYFELLEYEEQNPPFFKKIRQNKLIKYILSSLAGTALLTFLVQFIFNYISQRQAQTEQYQQQLITKYLDDIKEILLKQSQNNSTQSNNINIAENLARVKTITTLQQLDKKRKEDLLDFLIEAQLISNTIEEKNLEKKNFSKTISLNTPVQKPKSSSLQKQSTSSTPSQSKLIHISLSNADLRDVDLRKTNLSGADLSGANLSGANLSGTDLSGADLSGANLSGANLSKSNLRYAFLRYADINNANLKRADLKKARLREANLKNADLEESNLLEANLVGANLINAKLMEANLQNADLIGANLSKADLNFANTKGASFIKAKLEGAKLENRNLENAENSNENSGSLENKNADKICGPHTSTYAVLNLNKEFIGVRCVLFNDIKEQLLAKESPQLVWYGEGMIKNKPYHLIGQAFFIDKNDKSLINSISNIYNKLEQNKQPLQYSPKEYPNSSIYLHIKMKDNWKEPQKIFLKEKTNSQETLKEIWILQYYKKSKTIEPIEPIEPIDLIKNYRPQKQVDSCGNKLDEYTVYPILMRRTWRDSSWNNPFVKFMGKEPTFDWGIRCIFPEGVPGGNKRNKTTWFGTGIWEGKPYYHLGTYFNKGYGAVDICGFYQDPNKDKEKEPYCYKVDSGLLELKFVKSISPITSTTTSSGFDIDREWSEKWRK